MLLHTYVYIIDIIYVSSVPIMQSELSIVLLNFLKMCVEWMCTNRYEHTHSLVNPITVRTQQLKLFFPYVFT